MLTHLNPQPARPPRVVVLGAGGFIAGAIVKRLKADGIEVLALGRPLGSFRSRTVNVLAPHLHIDLIVALPISAHTSQ